MKHFSRCASNSWKLIAFLLFFGTSLFLLKILFPAQVSLAQTDAPVSLQSGGIPGNLAQGVNPLSEVALVSMPQVDVQALLAEDHIRAEQGLPPRFAVPIPVTITPQNYGTWEVSDAGEQVWRLRIQSDDALSINLGFGKFFMPDGGRLYLYSPDYTHIIGPFTAADNEAHGQLWTPLLPGSELVIELDLLPTELAGLDLELISVNHGYAEFGQPDLPESGSCNLDVVCGAADGYPQVDPWREQIRSSAVYQVNGSWTCSGSLVNNTAQDLRPYFLTANHCGVNTGNAATVVAYWNFENSWCRIPGSPASGGPGDGLLTQFNTGAIYRASYSPSDFTLIEFDDPVDPAFNPYWSGWDRTSNDSNSAVAIHHPNTDEKRISFEYDPTSTTSYLGTSVPGDGTHIRITDWDLGTTEPGSSGSPLYNQDQRIVGQLHGGYAACGNDLSDWYGRLSVSWDGGGGAGNRLRDWLDPLNTGVNALDGRNVIESPFTLVLTPAEAEVCAPQSAFYGITVTQEIAGFTDPVNLTAQGEPSGTTAIFSTNPVTPPGASSLTITNTGSAAPGFYSIDVIGSATTATFTSTINLSLFTTLPGDANLLNPADGSFYQPLLTSFSWSSAPWASSYEFKLAESPLFYTSLITATALPDPAFDAPYPLAGGRCYWWSVLSRNACGAGDWTEPFHFATVALQTIFSDDIESGAGNWSHNAVSGVDHWQIATAQSHSPTHSWFVPDDAQVTDSRLWITNPIQVGGGSELTFWHRYQFEGTSYDGSVLEISTDNGTSWIDLGPFIAQNGYNGTISSGYSNPLGGRQGWTGDLTNWTQVVVDLDSFAGQSVMIRWRLGCDSSISDVGWYIDDIQLTGPLPLNPAPTLAAISPEVGSIYENTPVEITGSGFGENPALLLGDTWLISITLVNSTTLNAVVPSGMSPGTYDLTIFNNDCQEAVLADAFTAASDEIPILGLSALNSSPTLLGFSTTFTASIQTGTNVTYSWGFGDGSYASGAHTTHTYADIGFFTATVTATNSLGPVITQTLVTVLDVPISGLLIENDSPTILGDATALTATQSSGSNITYLWDLGDGNFAAGGSVIHTYPAIGSYQVMVTGTNTSGSAVAQGTIHVIDVQIAGLSLASDSPTHLGSLTTFTATVSSGTNVSYLWDFGDGASIPGLGVASHQYAQAGNYTVKVTASNTISSQTVEIQVTVFEMEHKIYMPVTVR